MKSEDIFTYNQFTQMIERKQVIAIPRIWSRAATAIFRAIENHNLLVKFFFIKHCFPPGAIPNTHQPPAQLAISFKSFQQCLQIQGTALSLLFTLAVEDRVTTVPITRTLNPHHF
jgi:hypothetical protein